MKIYLTDDNFGEFRRLKAHSIEKAIEKGLDREEMSLLRVVELEINVYLLNKGLIYFDFLLNLKSNSSLAPLPFHFQRPQELFSQVQRSLDHHRLSRPPSPDPLPLCPMVFYYQTCWIRSFYVLHALHSQGRNQIFLLKKKNK